jgi:hypothetical protein
MRYRFHGEALPMMRTTDSCGCDGKRLPEPPATKPAARRRPPTLKEMNERARAFWRNRQ